MSEMWDSVAPGWTANGRVSWKSSCRDGLRRTSGLSMPARIGEGDSGFRTLGPG